MKTIYEMTAKELTARLKELREDMDRVTTYRQAMSDREFNSDFNRLNSEILAIENLQLRKKVERLEKTLGR